MSDRCSWFRCRQPYAVGYYRWQVCEGHWQGHGEKYDLYVEFYIKKRDPEFERRIKLLQSLLTGGDDESVLEFAPKVTKSIELFRLRPYLKGSARDRLPSSWDKFGKEEDGADHSEAGTEVH